jgi:hypothetical protein
MYLSASSWRYFAHQFIATQKVAGFRAQRLYINRILFATCSLHNFTHYGSLFKRRTGTEREPPNQNFPRNTDMLMKMVIWSGFTFLESFKETKECRTRCGHWLMPDISCCSRVEWTRRGWVFMLMKVPLSFFLVLQLLEPDAKQPRSL